MSANPQIDLQVDQHALREEVKIKYREVATDPHAEFHFTTGKPVPDAAKTNIDLWTD